MKAGIYTITNMHNGKYYIGRSSDFERRKKEHLRDLRRNDHANVHLQRSFNKYGEDAFVFELIEDIEDTSILEKLEQEYLDQLDYGNSYNTSKRSSGGGLFGIKNGMFGRHHTEEARQRMSEYRKGRKRRPHTEEENRINSLAHLGKKHSKDARKNMSEANRGEKNGFYGKHHTEETNNASAEAQAKTVRLISPSGDAVIITNLRKFYKENNLNRGSMNRLFANKVQQHKGWRIAHERLSL